MKLLHVLFIFIFGLSIRVGAQATFGAEFTFTNAAVHGAQTQGNIVNNPESERHRDLLAEATLASCNGCRKIVTRNGYGVISYKIQYPDGFYFVISTDPAVVEVQTKPMTSAEAEKNRSRLERDLFAAAKSVGLAPSERGTGGGHIHIGYLSATKGDLDLMRNILVDFANHPEMANGILNNDHWNSPPVQALPPEKQEALAQIIKDYDAGLIHRIAEFAGRIQNEVYDWHRAGWGPTEKYQAFNITRLADPSWSPEERTFEIRSLRPQMSAAQFIALINLFEGRIEYLKTLKEPVALKIPKAQTNREMYTSFSKYVADAGIDFKGFRNIMRMAVNSGAYTVPVYPAKALCFKLFR